MSNTYRFFLTFTFDITSDSVDVKYLPFETFGLWIYMYSGSRFDIMGISWYWYARWDLNQNTLYNYISLNQSFQTEIPQIIWVICVQYNPCLFESWPESMAYLVQETTWCEDFWVLLAINSIFWIIVSPEVRLLKRRLDSQWADTLELYFLQIQIQFYHIISPDMLQC